eukprot:Blabericola_migrator_1__3345@NODE_1989_length_3451_cov_9_109929_g1020_i3_p1_GENE_NODE_1989_length_3451_cov_9_109929_g1020_i3NODE_1989_length_3451_cov_9_109929_g1020_i3_p1_ORF_typecomplete_len335_score38_04Helitron_like_N/PF14214_6/3_5e03Helitron_like_N/PF14214_6/0_024_NODE_1989_length_3451_cov_9_109929_g1020_i33841388
MGTDEQISKFCKDSFQILPYYGRPQWLSRFISALGFFDFTDCSIPPNLEDAVKGMTEIRQAIALSLLDTSSMRKTALRIVQNNLDQIRCAVMRADICEEASKKLQHKMLKTLEQSEALCACTPHDSWHERVKTILTCFETCPTPMLWVTMKQLLNQVESAVADRCFSAAELRTITQVQKLAAAYADDPNSAATAHWAAACAARAAELRSHYSGNLHEAPQNVDKAFHSATEASEIHILEPLSQDSWVDCSKPGEMPSLKSSSHEPDNQQKSPQCVCKPLSNPATPGSNKHLQVEIPSGRPDTSPIRRPHPCPKVVGNLDYNHLNSSSRMASNHT